MPDLAAKREFVRWLNENHHHGLPLRLDQCYAIADQAAATFAGAGETPAFALPSDPAWDEATKFSLVNRDDIDAIYQAVLGCSFGDPWDQEPGCPRPMPDSPESAVDDGLSAPVDALDAFGNAVVPQVAEWIGRRIVEAARTSHT